MNNIYLFGNTLINLNHVVTAFFREEDDSGPALLQIVTVVDDPEKYSLFFEGYEAQRLWFYIKNYIATQEINLGE